MARHFCGRCRFHTPRYTYAASRRRGCRQRSRRQDPQPCPRLPNHLRIYPLPFWKRRGLGETLWRLPLVAAAIAEGRRGSSVAGRRGVQHSQTTNEVLPRNTTWFKRHTRSPRPPPPIARRESRIAQDDADGAIGACAGGRPRQPPSFPLPQPTPPPFQAHRPPTHPPSCSTSAKRQSRRRRAGPVLSLPAGAG